MFDTKTKKSFVDLDILSEQYKMKQMNILSGKKERKGISHTLL
jgi:hypothetical protein